MDKKLKKLFEYQKFMKNPHLDEVINGCYEKSYGIEVNDELLFAVGGGESEYDINIIMNLLHTLNLFPQKEDVELMIAQGGSTLRDWAKQQTNNDSKCNIIPIINK